MRRFVRRSCRECTGLDEALAPIATLINRAALDPGGWDDVFDGMRQRFGGMRCHLLGYDLDNPGTVPNVHVGYDPDFGTSYIRHYQHLNVWTPGWSGLPEGTVFDAQAVGPDAAIRRTEFYNDWVRPQDDIVGGGVVVLHRTPRRLVMLGGNLPRAEMARSQERWTAMLRALLPTLQHALEVSRMIGGLRLDAQALRLGEEPSDTALVLVAATGAIVHANATGEAMLADGRLVAGDGLGRLRFADPAATDRLRAALRSPAPKAAFAFDAGFAAARFDVRLLPVTPDMVAQLRLALFLERHPPILMIAVRRRTALKDETAAIRKRLGLTVAEAGVALALARGRTLAEIAGDRATSIHTVRNQLKSALSKCGARRQADPVLLVGGVSATGK